MRTITGLDELLEAEGEELGVSDWHEVTQEAINEFAEVTGDRYWIHTNPEKATAGPLGTTIAHGLYTLSLGPSFMYSIVTFAGFSMSLNYGYEKIRFPAPLPVGSRLRMHCRLAEVKRSVGSVGSAQATLHQTYEREGEDKPVCIAQHVVHLVA